jgi:hypothetical protein
MVKSRVWLFRILVLCFAGLLLLSWFLPWWSAVIPFATSGDALIIHPYGLVINLSESDLKFVGIDVSNMMPSWFTPVMWLYLGLAIAALLVGVFIKKDKSISLFGKKLNISRWLIGLVGFSYIVVAIAAVIVAAIRTGDYFGMHLLGTTTTSLPGYSYVDVSIEASLRVGYWLSCTAGLLLIILAFIRNKFEASK